MWGRRLKREAEGASQGIQEAQQALERAKADTLAVETRAPEVDNLYNRLVRAKTVDNFGPPLALATARRAPRDDS